MAGDCLGRLNVGIPVVGEEGGVGLSQGGWGLIVAWAK